MFPQIEKLKQELTDQYVVVNAGVPELRRFDGYVGQVKTVNMSGRALVQFDAWNNIGWYDIEVDYLKVVPKPEAGAAQKKHEEKAAAAPKAAKPAATGEKKLSPLEMARMQGAAGAAKAGGAAKPAAPKPAAAKPAAAPAGGKKTTAEILAAARAKAAPAAPPAQEATGEAAEEPAAEEVAAPAAAVAKPKGGAAKVSFPPGQRPGVAEILVWCRQHDTK